MSFKVLWHATVTADEIKFVEYETKILWDFAFSKIFSIPEPEFKYHWWMPPVSGGAGSLIIQN